VCENQGKREWGSGRGGEGEVFGDAGEDVADGDGGEDEAHDAADDAGAAVADEAVDAVGGEHEGEGDEEDGEHGDGDLHLFEEVELGVLGLQDRGEHGARTGNGGDGKREDGGLGFFPLRQLDLLFGFAFAEDHGEGEEEEDDAAGDLESGEGDVDGGEDEFASGDKEDEHSRREEEGFYGDLAAGGGVEGTGNREEDRDSADGIDDGEEEDEGGDDVDHLRGCQRQRCWLLGCSEVVFNH
jgi:hypothetical protein